MSGDIPRASFTNVFFSEVVGPFFLVLVTVIPFLFINSQPGNMTDPNSSDASNPTIRVAIVAFAPIAINAGVALIFSLMACCMGPCFAMCCKKFGGVLAAIAHAISVIILIVLFEAMWFLEHWSFPKALLGMIAATAIQRWFLKLLTLACLTREFKHDGANLSFWTGRWYGNKLGGHAFSQPAREFVCKMIELCLFSADFILGHILLFLMLPILAIPYVDRWHSVVLFWLRPSRQIRAPIFSMKQNRLRKRIVRRYATMFFVMFVIFMALIIGPAVAGKSIPAIDGIPFSLLQPKDRNATANVTTYKNSTT